MADHLDDRVEDDIDTPLWLPSPELRRRLWMASWLTLATGVLFSASSVASMTEGNAKGITVADGFAWAALLPALYLAFTYCAIAKEVDSPSLAKSVQCVFLVTVLLRIYQLATASAFNLFGQILVWSVFVLGLLGLVLLPFLSTHEKPTWGGGPPKPDPPTEDKRSTAEAAAAGATRAGALGAVVIGIFAVFKFFGKFLVKIALFKGIVNFVQNLAWHLVAVGLVILMAIAYLVWFAIAKIRLSKRLGGMAAVLGWFEIVRLIVVFGCGLLVNAEIADARLQPEMDPNARAEFEAGLLSDFAAIELGADVLWTALTICFFLSVRGRRDPQDDYQDLYAADYSNTHVT